MGGLLARAGLVVEDGPWREGEGEAGVTRCRPGEPGPPQPPGALVLWVPFPSPWSSGERVVGLPGRRL